MMGLFTRQLNCNANYEFQTKVLQFYLACVFYRQLGRILILYTREVGINLALVLLFVCLQSANPQKSSHFFFKVVLSILDFIHWDMN